MQIESLSFGNIFLLNVDKDQGFCACFCVQWYKYFCKKKVYFYSDVGEYTFLALLGYAALQYYNTHRSFMRFLPGWISHSNFFIKTAIISLTGSTHLTCRKAESYYHVVPPGYPDKNFTTNMNKMFRKTAITLTANICVSFCVTAGHSDLLFGWYLKAYSLF